jgi:GxxExxY protein
MDDTKLVYPELTREIIGAAIEVHKYWGPGLYEEIYERSLCAELGIRKMEFVSQVRLPLVYKDIQVGDDLRLDVWVAGKIVVEVKSVAELLPVHEAQVLTYMRLTKSRVGLLINFNVPVLKQGIRRFVL